MSDADAASKDKKKDPQPQRENDTPTPIGGMPAGPAPAIPDWYKVGWRQVGGVDETPLTEGEQKDRSVLELFLKEQYYGDWYYNAALIIFVCHTTIDRDTLTSRLFYRLCLHPTFSPVSVSAGVGYSSSSPFVPHTIAHP